MTRTGFLQLPPGGTDDQRQTASVVNQSMRGKTNNVDEFTTDRESGTVTEWIVMDDLVSADSYIGLMTLTEGATTTDLYIEVKAGEFLAKLQGSPSWDTATFRYEVVG